MWYHKITFNEGNHVLILRHGDRLPSTPGTFGNDTALTEKGKRASEIAGKRMKKIQWGEVHSSPLLRCRQTAESFLKGAGQDVSIQFSNVLGDPGIFVSQPEIAGPYFLKNTTDQMMHKLFSLESVPGMRSIEEGASLFINHLKTVKSFPCLMFSHDIIIALLKSYFYKTAPKLPKFLDGFYLCLI